MAYVKEMLYARGFHPEHGIRVLIDKSLMKIDRNGCVRMHDLIQDMGREIVRLESTFEPGNRSRLWFHKDIVHVLQNDTGTNRVEVIVLHSSKHKEVQWDGEAFKKMWNLRVLIVGDAYFSKGPEHLPNSLRVLDWSRYPSPSLPFDFHPNELLILSLPESCFKLDKPLKMFGSLSFMDFEDCEYLRRVPDLSGLPNLMALCLDNCTNLIEVHDSIGFLDKLILLSAQGCINLHTFLCCINLPSLETLDLRWCTSLQRFPEVVGEMENIREVYLDGTAIEELPFSIHNLTGLERLYLRGCRNFNLLPNSIRLLPKLEVIIVYNRRGCRLYEPYKVQEEVRSRVFFYSSQCSHRACAHYEFVAPFYKVNREDVPLRNITMPESCILEKSGSSRHMSFKFRRRIPDVSLFLWVDPPVYKGMHGSAIEFRLCVLINESIELSSSSDFIISQKRVRKTSTFYVSLGDIRSQIEEDVLKRVSSLDEWNHADVFCEIKYHRPYDPKWVSSDQNRSIAATIAQSITTVNTDNTCSEDGQFVTSGGAQAMRISQK